MSAREVLWRIHGAYLTRRDRLLLKSIIAKSKANATKALKASVDDNGASSPSLWQAAPSRFAAANLTDRANAAVQGKLQLLGGAEIDCGAPIDWNRDHKNNIATPMGYSPAIDYRDVRESGDAKWAWEPSRHHHFVLLARAFCETNDERFLQALESQWLSWLDQCPFQQGMQWRSPLELGIRLINWAWAWQMVDGATRFDESTRQRILEVVDLHLYDVTNKYSRGSSANNHLVGEAAGVLVAAAAFPELPKSDERFAAAHDILAREIAHQILPDGGNAEGTTGYHVFVLQFFTIAGLVARARQQDFDNAYWERLRQGYNYLAALCAAGGPMPKFNDADDGYVLDLDNDPRDHRPWLAVGAVLFDEPQWLHRADNHHEAAARLFGDAAVAALVEKAEKTPLPELTSQAFESAGHYALQAGDEEENVSMIVDCAPLGFGAIAAHGHADALSFTLRSNGRELLTDPGTYDYFTYREWRDHYRKTATHNTITIDGEDQSEMLGLFLWGQRATANCVKFNVTDEKSEFVGMHDGYESLSDPVRHQRRIVLDHQTRNIVIEDTLTCRGRHEAALYFHAADGCSVEQSAENVCRLAAEGAIARLELDDRLRTTLVHASENGMLGWVSRGYHVQTAATAVVARGVIDGTTTFRTQIQCGEATDSISLAERKQTVGVGRAGG